MDRIHLQKIRPNLEKRAALWRAVRETFDRAGFLEVETDVRIPAPAPEEFIESICAEGEFLRASPEIAMKIMLAAGYEKIYQIGRCFRADEFGSRHRTEFTMLEYYAAGWDYKRLAEFTADCLRNAAHKVNGSGKLLFRGQEIDLDAEPEWISVKESFARYAPEEGDFDELMVTRIEPNLGRGRMTFLYDYPADRASLARLNPEGNAERWELYIAGLELANAFGELIDPVEQRKRFEATLAFRKEQGMHEYPMAEDFFEALEHGLPESSGSALGMDRLAMVFCNCNDIGDVRAE